MEKYNYREAVKDDVLDYIRNEINFTDYEDMEELYEYLDDRLFADDSVTGNASGSYFCNSYKAEEALCHNWDLLVEGLEEFGMNHTDALWKDPEALDVTIRCYVLHECIGNALEEIKPEFEKAQEVKKAEKEKEEEIEL